MTSSVLYILGMYDLSNVSDTIWPSSQAIDGACEDGSCEDGHVAVLDQRHLLLTPEQPADLSTQ